MTFFPFGVLLLIIRPPLTDLEKIKEVIILSENYVFTCAISSLNEDMQSIFLSSKEINTELLDEFARNVAVFFIGAYDGEGYLMWVKRVE